MENLRELNEMKKSDKIRLLVVQLYCASGCSCCRDDEEWKRCGDALGRLLDIPPYGDGSGFDFYSVKEAATLKEPTT
jgi:hypothetical protein